MPESLPLSLLDAALRGTLVTLLLLLAAVLYRDRPQLSATRAGIAMLLGLCVQVVSSLPLFEALVPRLWQAPLVAVSVGNAVLFWIFVQTLFNDDFAFRPLHLAAWLSVAFLSGLNCALLANSSSVVASATVGLQRAVPLLFAGLAAMAATVHWREDLVEGRRRLRGFIAVTGIFYTLASLIARLASPQGRLIGMTATLDVAVLLVIVMVAALSLLRLGGSDLFPLPRQPAGPNGSARVAGVGTRRTDSQPSGGPAPRADPGEERLAEALQHLMLVERIYRSEDLNVASLAARLAVPGYRLRRLINQRLGYRNFNTFINGFRLDQARSVLSDPARRELPVLTIALDSGFQSIGPFNRAFKVATGLTPTEFRKENRADS